MRCRSIRPDTVAFSSLKGLSADRTLCAEFEAMPAMRNRFPLAKHGKTKPIKLLVQEHFQIPCWISVVDPCAFVDRWPRFLAAGHIFSEARGTGRGKLWKDCERFGKLDTGVRPAAGDRLMWILNDTEILRYYVNWNGHGPMVDICGHAQSHSVQIVLMPSDVDSALWVCGQGDARVSSTSESGDFQRCSLVLWSVWRLVFCFSSFARRPREAS